MSVVRYLISPMLLGLVLATSAAALPYSPSQRAQIFAVCAGRLSALEEHQRLFDGPASEHTQSVLRRFESLLEAVMPDAVEYGMPGRQVWSWRINAKQAQSLLLSRATFSQDQRLLQRSKAAADQYISDCKGLVLGV